jgi:hypothetical protein
MDRPSAYNAIIGRITLNELKAMTFTPHLSMKFLNAKGVKVVEGDQVAAQQCYNTILKSPSEKTNLKEKTKEDGK